MPRSNQTKQLLAQSLQELMVTTPLEKISVNDIVDHAGVGRNTFYYHFEDKYDLVNWHFSQLADRSFRQMGSGCTLKEGLIKKFQFIQNEKRFFISAFQSRDYNSLMQYDYECILEFYTNIIKEKTGKSPNRDIVFLLEMYCRGSIDMTVEWVRKNMNMEPEAIANLLILALPRPLEELFSDIC